MEFWILGSWQLWLLTGVVLVADQISKAIIIGWLDWRESWPAEGFFRFTHIGNTGTAFSLFQGNSDILAIVALGAVALLLWIYWSIGGRSPLIRLALGLQLGGAFGNLIDRVRLGHVTDFIDVGPWPIFNLADSAISIGMVLMIWFFFFVAKDDVSAEATTAAVHESMSLPGSVRCQRCADSMRYGIAHEREAIARAGEDRP